MADILIKNMEMPKERIMLEIFPNGRVLEINPHNNARIPTEAEAIELPSHGRLKDLDVMQKEIAEKVCEDCHAHCGDVCDVYRCLSVIYNSPTIVEASNGSDN